MNKDEMSDFEKSEKNNEVLSHNSSLMNLKKADNSTHKKYVPREYDEAVSNSLFESPVSSEPEKSTNTFKIRVSK